MVKKRITNEKMKQTYKPGSAFHRVVDSCHLSAMTLTRHLNQSTHWGNFRKRKKIDEQPCSPTYLTFQPTRFTRVAIAD
jgi:hypothetical protein